MRPIPKPLLKKMLADPFYQQCCITGKTAKDEKIELHHNLIFASRQVNEEFAILPLAKSVHDNIVYYKSLCDYIMWSRATEAQRKFYSKAIDYEQYYQFLKKKHGK